MKNDGGKKQQVCSSFLTKILQISRKTLFKAIQSIGTNPNAVQRRGKYPTRKTDARDIQFCEAFIRKHATFDSHHDYQYLHPRLNIRMLYDLYCQTIENESERKMLAKSMFRKFFKRDFNLRILKCKQKCTKCNEVQTRRKAIVLKKKAKNKLSVKWRTI